ncbi:hypothetical protein G8C93_06990 [Cellulosimicrobium cellulans]|uniref:PASTA domain-containing protein n=1 Tax=Cellulosimicrobium cellulans TaxID=1710 RepID=UPI00188346C1|nr:PASTA domain-containing protein [Cellulosimicrobium cellulans]MBE9925635.1 hypothetical protein [Cellulosimicrobium cellulans]
MTDRTNTRKHDDGTRDAARPRVVGAPRRARAVVLAVVAVTALAGCRVEGLPGGPGSPSPSPTSQPTTTPTPEPTVEPTPDPTEEPTGGPGGPGSSDGIEVSVEIEPAFSMPNVVETRLKQARADIEKRGAVTVVVVDARDARAGALPGAANGWTVCAQDPEGGDLVRASQTVTLDAAPNAKQCP